MPHITRASLTKFSGNALSPLRLQLAYSTTTRWGEAGKQAFEFGHAMARASPCMLFLMKKLGGFSHLEQSEHLNHEFTFALDRSPIRFDTRYRVFSNDVMDLCMLTGAKKRAHEVLADRLFIYGPTQIYTEGTTFSYLHKPPSSNQAPGLSMVRFTVSRTLAALSSRTGRPRRFYCLPITHRDITNQCHHYMRSSWTIRQTSLLRCLVSPYRSIQRIVHQIVLIKAEREWICCTQP
jgi:hypothetical protein